MDSGIGDLLHRQVELGLITPFSFFFFANLDLFQWNISDALVLKGPQPWALNLDQSWPMGAA